MLDQKDYFSHLNKASDVSVLLCYVVNLAFLSISMKDVASHSLWVSLRENSMYG